MEELRAKVDLERAEVARDVEDNRVMAMGWKNTESNFSISK